MTTTTQMVSSNPPQQLQQECRHRLRWEFQTRDAKIRSCLFLITILGVPAFMIWGQVMSAMPLPEAGINSEAIIVVPQEEGIAMEVKDQKSHTGLDLASDVAVAQSKPSMSSANASKPNTNEQSRPKMVWLMSFPNSGTSYTMRMVASASNRAIATNYGPEVASENHPISLPLYPSSRKEASKGPFVRGASDGEEKYKPLPDSYIITKTHCGGRCVRCSPRKYVLTLPQFVHACTEGQGCFAPEDSTQHTKHNNNTSTVCEWKDTHYPPPPHNPRISKLIHLIRNPFDNIVSRYHLARKNEKHRLKDNPKELEAWMDLHANNAAGFLRWCNELDSEYGSPFMAASKNNKIPTVSPDLTCQAEWFRYLQWHTLALETLELSRHDLPSLTIYYEDYANNWNATVRQILDFLEVPRPLEDEAVIREFVSRPPYDEYFTDQQRTEARSLVKQLASKKVWKLLKRYFR